MQLVDLRIKRRSAKGQQSAEFAGIFMFFLLVIFFPMLDFLAMSALFGAGMILNAEACREASLVANRGTTGAADTTAVTDADGERTSRVKKVSDAWKNGGLGHFFNIVGDPVNKITVTTVGSGSNPDQYVHVETNITGSPFLNIPFPMDVPGMNKPMTFNYSQERLIEQ